MNMISVRIPINFAGQFLVMTQRGAGVLPLAKPISANFWALCGASVWKQNPGWKESILEDLERVTKYRWVFFLYLLFCHQKFGQQCIGFTDLHEKVWQYNVTNFPRISFLPGEVKSQAPYHHNRDYTRTPGRPPSLPSLIPQGLL